MPLQFVVRINRKAPARIGVLRTFLKDGKIESKENLGTLHGLDDDSLAAFIVEKKLNLQEQYQLASYVANLKFNKTEFNTAPENLRREFLYFAPNYEDALMELWQLARQHNIDFCPAEVQQIALLNKAKAVERKLNELTGKPINMLEKIGLDIRRFEPEEFKQRVDKTSKQLFKLLLTVNQSLENLCSEFMQISRQHYHKNANLKPHYFKKYANNVNRLPLWYNTVAIDLLIKYNLNPLDKISAAKIAEHWIRLRKDKITFEEACIQFKKTFSPKSEDEPAVLEAIKAQYEQGLSTAKI